MSIEVKTNIKDPLGWIHEDYGVWNLISDYTNLKRYEYLDSIYHYLVDGIKYFDESLKGKTKEELKEEYNTKFPLLLAEAFKSISEDIVNGELMITTEFD